MQGRRQPGLALQFGHESLQKIDVGQVAVAAEAVEPVQLQLERVGGGRHHVAQGGAPHVGHVNEAHVLANREGDLIDQVIGIGTCSGVDTDKFRKFGLTPLPGRQVQAPRIKECWANLECRVIDIVRAHGIVVLDGLAAYVDDKRQEKRTFHAVGDGTFIVDGRRLSRRSMMRSKLPAGV